MAEPFLGEIRIFAFSFTPQGWAMCNGQLLSIQQNTALFSLLGTQYGGDGVQTFALPNLQSRVAIHQGQGPGLSPYTIGQTDGSETHTLLNQEMPQHTHAVNCNSAKGKTNSPVGGFLSKDAGNQSAVFAPTSDGSTMAGTMLSPSGGNQAFSIIQPYLTLNFCIALQGIFPSRN